MRKLSLSILDRISLIAILPREGNFLELTISKDIQSKIEIGQEEATANEFKFLEGGRVTWKKDAPDKEVEFSDSEFGIVQNQLKKLDDQKKLTPELIEPYKKFNVTEEAQK